MLLLLQKPGCGSYRRGGAPPLCFKGLSHENQIDILRSTKCLSGWEHERSGNMEKGRQGEFVQCNRIWGFYGLSPKVTFVNCP